MPRKTFTITIDLASAAFDEDANAEVARLLRGVAAILDKAPQTPAIYKMRDANGNTCGTWGYAA